jgi:hypothetical protein
MENTRVVIPCEMGYLKESVLGVSVCAPIPLCFCFRMRALLILMGVRFVQLFFGSKVACLFSFTKVFFGILLASLCHNFADSDSCAALGSATSFCSS